MRKMTVTGIVVVVLLLSLSMPGKLYAQVLPGDRWEIDSGIAYYTFDLTDVKEGQAVPHDEKLKELKTGTGFYVNGNLWLTSHFGLQAGYDAASADAVYEGVSFIEQHNRMTGYRVGMAARWTPALKLHLSVGRYELVELASIAGIGVTTRLSGPALIGGVQLSTPINAAVSVHGGVDVRMAGVSVNSKDEDKPVLDPGNYTNISGVRCSVGLNVKF